MDRRKHIVLYDSDCPLCTFQMRLVTWLDWLNKVRLLPINDPQVAGIAPGLTGSICARRSNCVTPAGAIHRGARCFRFLGFRLPVLLPLGLFLWVPGVIWIAEKFYMWVSRNRHLLSKVFGCKGACAILPERKRDREAGS